LPEPFSFTLPFKLPFVKIVKKFAEVGVRLFLVLLASFCLVGGAYAEGKSEKGDYRCGKKRYCSQMTSCEEAVFYYRVCGLKRLDRDRDGIPCEKLCR